MKETHKPLPECKSKYDDHSKMIHKMAWRYSNDQVEVDELMSEGYIIYRWCMTNWDTSKGAKFSSYLYNNLQARFSYHVFKTRRDSSGWQGWQDNNEKLLYPIDAESSIEHNTLFKSILQSLSADARFCVETIWNTPAELYEWVIEEKTKPTITLKLLKRYLNKIVGWPYSHIGKVFNEIKTAIK